MEKGLRQTRQREIILAAFLGAEDHMTVDQLHRAVAKDHPEIGYATVHRNLQLFRECGLAEEIKVGNEKTRFEPSVGKAHHDHLICLKCGSFIEVFDPKIERLQENLARQKGFSPVRHRLEIYGYCRNCR